MCVYVCVCVGEVEAPRFRRFTPTHCPLSVLGTTYFVQDDVEVVELAVEVSTYGDLLGDGRGRLVDVGEALERASRLVQQLQDVASVQRLCATRQLHHNRPLPARCAQVRSEHQIALHQARQLWTSDLRVHVLWK